MSKILDIAFSGFWAFVGMATLLTIFLHYGVNGMLRLWSRFTRVLMVRKQGWPPEHLDADGDFKTK